MQRTSAAHARSAVCVCVLCASAAAPERPRTAHLLTPEGAVGSHQTRPSCCRWSCCCCWCAAASQPASQPPARAPPNAQPRPPHAALHPPPLPRQAHHTCGAALRPAAGEPRRSRAQRRQSHRLAPAQPTSAPLPQLPLRASEPRHPSPMASAALTPRPWRWWWLTRAPGGPCCLAQSRPSPCPQPQSQPR
jgi:hypothetical protein